MKAPKESAGPLAGVVVLELEGIGPAPFAAMLLGDLGAEVIRIDRPLPRPGRIFSDPVSDPLNRGRRSIRVDLKSKPGLEVALRLAEAADCLVEGLRPGSAERLGLGPEECLARNPRLVYGRVTGFGRSGPYASMAGHDIDFLALSGALSLFGRAGAPPFPPVNVVGDFAAGGLMLALGIVAALVEARAEGKGQVVDRLRRRGPLHRLRARSP
jgi:alpha-methylacyl-CoA racemase